MTADTLVTLVLAGVSKLDVVVLLLNVDFGNFAIQNNTGIMKTLSLLAPSLGWRNERMLMIQD